MYLDSIEALPLQISGLSFLKGMSFLNDKASFTSLLSICRSNFNKFIHFLPDVLIPGDFHHRDDLFDLDPQLKTKPDHLLLITGVPDNSPTLDFYKFKDAVYTKYFEAEDNKGYLFQVVPSKSPLIPISYGAY